MKREKLNGEAEMVEVHNLLILAATTSSFLIGVAAGLWLLRKN